MSKDYQKLTSDQIDELCCKIMDNFQQYISWISMFCPDHIFKYHILLEHDIEILEVHWCGSFGGFGGFNHRDYQTISFDLFNRFHFLVTKAFKNEKRVKVSYNNWITLDTFKKYFDDLARLNGNFFRTKIKL